MNDETKQRFPVITESIANLSEFVKGTRQQAEMTSERREANLCNDAADRAEEEIRETETLLTHWEETQAQPIETAPMDGTRISVFTVDYWTPATGRRFRPWTNDSNRTIENVTHWMPLPKPPQ